MKQTIKELTDTSQENIRGTSIGTQYGMQPVQFLKDVIDGAKKQLFFANFVKVMHAPKGVYEVVIPLRTTYEGRSGMTFDASGADTANGGLGGGSGAGSGPYANTIADITWTALDNIANVSVTPLPILAGYELRRHLMDTNIINMVDHAKEELTYAIGDRIDRLIATTVGDATDAATSTLGMQILYGGDANTDQNTTGALAAGDVITTDLVAKGARYLKDTVMKYRTSGAGAEATASITKNPWQNTPDDPYVLFIGPAQEETFLKDSQFVNAAEYGSNMVIQNGEIGSYLRIKIVVTTNIESVASGSTGVVSGSATGTDTTFCILMKPKASVALVWGRDPEIKVFDWPTRDSVRIGLYCSYGVTVIHPDAIVGICVADA